MFTEVAQEKDAQLVSAQYTMALKGNVRTLCSRMQTILRRRKQKQNMEISAPFNLRLEPSCIPGITQEEIMMLRDKAAASRIGIAESLPRSPSLMAQSPILPSHPRLRTPRSPLV
ncbi:hypothetical protein B0I35DRAFT_472976 [Stachybotrys elegans]|uniref:Uncharacterized protein n=1 Tax=Stachybotrys elegans TaxID=80388 RepID=A0A8K0T6X7_9HYPO|nr:hypothetical protein B0I35DRAFT_472976 [Stachybotrys elegans]